MYMSKDQHCEALYQAWQASEARLNKLGKEMNKAIKKAEKIGNNDPVAYSVACANIEDIRLMYSVLATEVTDRYTSYKVSKLQAATV